ncbi:STAS domain-containing protein [Nocardioides sp. MAH-18]|uniref:STAS domain-containing protein n=1 Tax=Nocardioides agri TaxID=2682843 RepID=A0A6L6XND1_9ACTN|nr:MULTISPECIES: STAS domain-containing protein [unclassified Nocardioides]MBA2953726.1 STAS domain-containing protein [Nocardioides sp. CGMCC 1.13656]MVQ48590.1 STAS domain-containing protein [Nocardioides sp. MAH-18]
MDGSDFHLSVQVEPPHARIKPSGEFDAFTARQLAAEVDDALAAGCIHFRLEFSDVTFIDAAGVGQLVRLYNLTNAVDGTLAVDAPSTCVRRLCTLVHVENLLGVEPATWPCTSRPRVPGRGHVSSRPLVPDRSAG